MGEGAVQRLYVVEVGQAGEVVAQNRSREVAFEQIPTQRLGFLTTAFGVEQVYRGGFPGWGKPRRAVLGVSTKGPAAVRRGGG